MKAISEAMNVMASMKEVYDITLDGRSAASLSDDERGHLSKLEATIRQAAETGTLACQNMYDSVKTSDDSSVILSFMHLKSQILQDLD